MCEKFKVVYFRAVCAGVDVSTATRHTLTSLPMIIAFCIHECLVFDVMCLILFLITLINKFVDEIIIAVDFTVINILIKIRLIVASREVV